jgi:hypothetical protein
VGTGVAGRGFSAGAVQPARITAAMHAMAMREIWVVLPVIYIFLRGITHIEPGLT